MFARDDGSRLELDPDASEMAHGARLFAFCVIAAITLFVAIYALRHNPETVHRSTGIPQAHTRQRSSSFDGSRPSGSVMSEAASMERRVALGLSELSAKQGHYLTYTVCADDTLCVRDGAAPSDGLIENFVADRTVASQLFKVGFRTVVFTNGSVARRSRITDSGFVPAGDVRVGSDLSPEQ